MLKIVLDELEIKVGSWLAEKRYLVSRQANLKGYENTTGKSKLDLEKMALLGEYAFAKLCNVHFPLSQDPAVYASRPDFTLPNGLKVDVKTTDGMNHRLLLKVKEYETAPCDLYALMIAQPPAFYFAGWVAAADLMRQENIVHFTPYPNGQPRPPAYAVSQAELVKELPIFIVERI